jgi:hypothetical protein
MGNSILQHLADKEAIEQVLKLARNITVCPDAHATFQSPY